jgi:hypothetical protein
MNNNLHAFVSQWFRAGLILGLVGLALCGFGAVRDPQRFYISYLFGYLFWLGLTLGCFEVAMIHHLTGGRWGFASRRLFEAGFMTLPLMALLFVPVLFGLRDLYPWARPEAVAGSLVLQHKQIYLNTPAFIGRACFFFLVWMAMAWRLRKWSLAQDTTKDPGPTVRLRTLSGPGVVLYPLTGTFAFIDWLMSIEPGWFSTIFLVIVLAGQVLSAFAFVTLWLAMLRRFDPWRQVLTSSHFHDLGNLLLTFVMFWTYVSFSELLIIYSGNLPREIELYLHRIGGVWKWMVCCLALIHFFVPFFFLLLRAVTLQVTRLTAVAALIFVAEVMAIYWFVMPTFYPGGPRVHWLDVASWLGLGGVWLAAFSSGLRRRAVLPQNDPRIDYTLVPLANAK